MPIGSWPRTMSSSSESTRFVKGALMMHDVTKERWDYVKAVEPLEGSRLAVTFRDGKSGVYDMGPKLEYPCYAPLEDRAFFARAFVEFGTVCWPGDIDIAPEELYFNCVEGDSKERLAKL